MNRLNAVICNIMSIGWTGSYGVLFSGSEIEFYTKLPVNNEQLLAACSEVVVKS